MLAKRRVNFFHASCTLVWMLALLVCGLAAHAETDSFWIKRLLEKDRTSKAEQRPVASIYRKHDILYCTGASLLAKTNNTAAEHMEAGDYDKAIMVFKQGLENSALFFPFRYNIGVCYLHQKQYAEALLHLHKAMYIVPEYAHTYIQIGYIHEMRFEDDTAIDFYRRALRQNPKEINAYVLIGDIYFKRKQYAIAKRYYDKCLQIDHRFSNALLGLAKIHFIKNEYIKTMVLLKSINTSDEYDKALHYYYAECAYKLQDYKTASQNYELLLKYRTDKFFIVNDPGDIEKKLKLSNQLKEYQLK